MTAYLPLARKYRPQNFTELIGQPHVSTTLTRALEGKRVAQAYIFTGQRGVGKTSAARILAKCLNCERGPTATPCQTCASCTQITKGSSLDVIEIDGASNRGIDEIRSLRESVPFAPTSGPFRVYIIDEVHMLTTEAFNALLKTLEEPPAHVKFIFATTVVNKVPPTILSRCQRFDFRRVDAATMVGVLKRIAKAEKLQVTEPALYTIARAADGSLRDAEVVLEQLASFVQGEIHEPDVTALLGTVESDALFAWTQAILDHDSPQALAVLMSQVEQGKDVLQLLTGLLRHMRNLLIIRSISDASAPETLLARLVDEPSDRLKRLAEQAGGIPAQELLLMLQILTGAYELVRRSPMGQTILELVVIKLSTREQWRSLEEISRRLEQLSAGHRPPAVGGGTVMPSPAEISEAGRGTTPSAAVRRSVPDVPPATSSPAPTTPAPVQPAGEPTASLDSARDAALPAPAIATGEPGSEVERAAHAETTASISMPEEIRTVWPVFLERLGAEKMSLAAYLAHARPLQLDGGTLTVGLAGFSLHEEVLSDTENRRLIDRILSELYKSAIQVRYTTLSEPVEAIPLAETPSEAVASASPMVQDIVKLFNATIDKPRTT